jgi:hypothetical protein
MLLHTHYLNVSTVKLRRLIESNGKNKSRLWHGFHCRSHTAMYVIL